MNKCSDCGGELEKGVLLDHTLGFVAIQRYAQSDNIPTDTNIPLSGRIEANFKNIRRVLAFRCMKCNKINTYAQDIVFTEKKVKYLQLRVLAILLIGILAIAAVIFWK